MLTAILGILTANEWPWIFAEYTLPSPPCPSLVEVEYIDSMQSSFTPSGLPDRVWERKATHFVVCMLAINVQELSLVL